ncbi:MAG: transposase [Armatimonadetes bacterium]|nr:transposase [Armatimonadota bacterium]
MHVLDRFHIMAHFSKAIDDVSVYEGPILGTTAERISCAVHANVSFV